MHDIAVADCKFQIIENLHALTPNTCKYLVIILQSGLVAQYPASQRLTSPLLSPAPKCTCATNYILGKQSQFEVRSQFASKSVQKCSRLYLP